MAKFIEIETTYEDETRVSYINPALVRYVRPTDKGMTVVSFQGGGYVMSKIRADLLAERLSDEG